MECLNSFTYRLSRCFRNYWRCYEQCRHIKREKLFGTEGVVIRVLVFAFLINYFWCCRTRGRTLGLAQNFYYQLCFVLLHFQDFVKFYHNILYFSLVSCLNGSDNIVVQLDEKHWGDLVIVIVVVCTFRQIFSRGEPESNP